MNGVLPFGAGGLTAAGWFVFADAILIRKSGPDLELVHWIPGAIGTTALFMAIVAPYRDLARDDTFGGGSSSKQCARLWMFLIMLLSLASIYGGGGIATLIHDRRNLRFGGGPLVDDTHRWVGSAIVCQAMLLAGATSLWVLRRIQVQSDAF